MRSPVTPRLMRRVQQLWTSTTHRSPAAAGDHITTPSALDTEDLDEVDTSYRYTDGYSEQAIALADALVDNGLTPRTTLGSSCGHGDTYTLSADAPLPQWLHRALSGAVFTDPEGPWPEWGRTTTPIDWPALIAQHPDFLAPDADCFAPHSATWEAITDAFTRARTADEFAALDVILWVSPDATILVEPWAMTSPHLPLPVAQAITATLSDSGRPHRLLHPNDGDQADGFWLLTN